jgi:hypothetical protein
VLVLISIVLKQSTHLHVNKPKESQAYSSQAISRMDGTLILSGHQPTLLPYPGFFYRMYHSNIMDICPYDPLSKHSDRFQHRVKIGTDDKWRWFTIPIEAPSNCRIFDAKIKTEFLAERWQQLEDVYKNYPLWSTYKEELKEILFSYKHLWELNMRLILWVRDLLDIKTYISISYGAEGSDTTERLASQFTSYGYVVYLAGKGTAEYLDMEKYRKLTNSTIAVVTYTPPTPFSTVSILTPLLLYPPKVALETLNIRKEPVRVVVNGAEFSVHYNNSYLNCSSTSNKSL